ADCFDVEIEKDADEDLGLVFAHDVFDRVRRCRNNCVFCFERQMPAGMRPSLSLRDDDFRLSFLHGNFLTLTNLRPDDLARIVRERLTPLYVSIHATDPAVRRAMLRNRAAGDILAQVRLLGDHGIQVHGQIVLCPGWNDGPVLARTLNDLAALYPAVLSVGVVPVGLTAHRPAGPDVRAVTPGDAEAVLDLIAAMQAALLPRLGTRLVFAADECYLMTGRPLPPDAAYEEYAQAENGIGLSRRFLDEAAALHIPPLPARAVTLATGALAAPLVESFTARLRAAGADARVAAVPNRFYGGGVSVAGLLTGRDLLAALRGRDLGAALILPAVTLNADGRFLDDLTPADLEAALGVPLHFCADPAEVVAALTPERPLRRKRPTRREANRRRG
ncbi:MAG TPA: DUF512 domain-containing protein, partial [Armatimonadota bacterium]|nr:DUF512 domain-containing protein [Armatimonadota bacterium]